MNARALALLFVVCLGAVLIGIGDGLGADKVDCSAEEQAVAAAKANVAAAQASMQAALDRLKVHRELMSALDRQLDTAEGDERNARAQWEGAIMRWKGCASKPRDNACEAELAAIDRATEKLNTCHQKVLQLRNEIDAAHRKLLDLQEAAVNPIEVWLEALAALRQAEEALAKCRNQPRNA